MKVPTIPVLFCRSDSIYKRIPGSDVYDLARDARTFQGLTAVITHPPCPQWSRLRKFSRDDPESKALAPWSVDLVRKNGGILEHPAGSSLWDHCQLPKGNQVDEFGGFTIIVPQWWFGHGAWKATNLYMCGLNRSQVPSPPLRLGVPDFVVCGGKGHAPAKPHLPKPDREHTPEAFATWLLHLARIIETNKSK